MLTLLLSKTFLTKPLSFSIVKRFMRSVTNMAKTLLIPKPHSALPSRGMASIHGGRWNKQGIPLRTSKGTQPESDLTGKHKVAFVGRCTKTGCKDQNCATGTQLSTGTKQPNACGEPPQYHTQAPSPHPIISYEVAGNTTSTIPSNKNGITVDGQVQIDGAQQPQKLVTEKNTVKICVTSIKEDQKTTAYLQKDHRTEAVLLALPADSTIK